MNSGTRKKLEEESLHDVLKYGMYRISSDSDGDYWVCNMCGCEFELRMDVLDHIVECHLNEVLPDVYPGDLKE